MFKNKKIAVVVPAYNEEELIEKTIATMPDYVDKIIVVDDCSKDSTPQILKSLKEKNPKLTIIRHKENMGVGKAIITGYEESIKQDMDITAVMAGDAQMDPEDLPGLLAPVAEGKADYTKGNRLLTRDVRKAMPGLRYFGNSLLTILNKIATGYWNVMDPQCGYTAISKKALQTIHLDEVYHWYGFPNDLLAKLNVFSIKVMDVPVRAVYGTEKSGIRLYSYIPKVSFLLLRDFLWRLKEKYLIRDFHPLLLFYFFGFLLTLAGILLAAWILYIEFISAAPRPASANEFTLFAFLTIVGVQSIFFAMWFDMQYNKQ